MNWLWLLFGNIPVNTTNILSLVNIFVLILQKNSPHQLGVFPFPEAPYPFSVDMGLPLKWCRVACLGWNRMINCSLVWMAMTDMETIEYFL